MGKGLKGGGGKGGGGGGVAGVCSLQAASRKDTVPDQGEDGT